MFDVLRKMSSYMFSRKNYNYAKVLSASVIELLTTAINITAPLIIVDSLASSDLQEDTESSSLPIAFAYSAGAALLVAQTLPRFRNMLVNSVRANVQKEMTYSMVEKTFANELDQQVNARTGEFSQALTKIYSSVDKGVPAIFEISSFILEMVAVTVVLTILFGPIGLVPAGIFFAYGLAGWYGERTALPIRTECAAESYRAYGAVIEAVSNYQIAHQFGNVGYELQKVNTALVRSETHYRTMHQKDDRNSLLLSAINGLGFIGSIILFILVPQVQPLTVADIALFFYFMMRLNARLDALPSAISSFYTSLVDGQRVVQFLNRPSAVVDIDAPLELNSISPLRIEFRNVCFSYGGRDILTDINFTVAAGEKLAIAGPTGCGKSTIMKLLLRFYPVTSGEILINGVDITLYSAQSLRRNFAIVSQDSIMFNNTIEENIRYGDLEATDEDVLTAAQYAELVTEENALWLKESAGQQGARLSGGERQRASIARALLKGGKAFILDEPTSALDAKTEAEVQRTLDQITLYATTLLVTHRLSAAVNADNIIYMEGGRIVERGTFEELVANHEGYFSQQLRVQCAQLGVGLEQIRPLRVQELPTMSGLHSFWRRKESGTSPHQVYELPIIGDSGGIVSSSGSTSTLHSLPRVNSSLIHSRHNRRNDSESSDDVSDEHTLLMPNDMSVNRADDDRRDLGYGSAR